jgi:hypothetical protein
MNTNKTLGIFAVLTAFGLVMATTALLPIIPQAQAQKVPPNANPVGQTVNKNGGSPNQVAIQSCKGVLPANECATGDLNNGEFTSRSAHFFNGPK